MKNLDVVIRNGVVATAADVSRCDIGVSDGKIVAVAEHLENARKVIDADGKYVLPGGVDAHCHLDQPTSDGSSMADDFESGTRSAACGGTTTVIPFALQFKGQSLNEAVIDYHRRADGRASIDYAFHLIVTDPTPEVLERELPGLVEKGYSSFKIYMTYDDLKLNDRQILETLAVARREGAMTMIHAENSDCIAWLTETLERCGHLEPRYHASSRPPVVEREATHRAMSLAELVDVPVLIVHVSGREAIEQIRWAQARGIRIYAETCPQYLFLTAKDLDLDGFKGAQYICSPPPRDEKDQLAVWDGLQDGLFQVFSSDHAPFNYDDASGKKIRGESTPFRHVPNGLPGVETRLPLLFSRGVIDGRIDITQFVALTATNPARMYGLYPRKGTIAVGADADLVIWDQEARWTISNSVLHHNADYTPYEGMELVGKPILTLSRGRTVWDDGDYLGQPGGGEFLPCDRPQLARPKGKGTV